MTKAGEQLRDRAFALRRLADAFDVPEIRERLLILAAQCEALAASLDEAPPGFDPSDS